MTGIFVKRCSMAVNETKISLYDGKDIGRDIHIAIPSFARMPKPTH
jgi:hypothetical protein